MFVQHENEVIIKHLHKPYPNCYLYGRNVPRPNFTRSNERKVFKLKNIFFLFLAKEKTSMKKKKQKRKINKNKK